MKSYKSIFPITTFLLALFIITSYTSNKPTGVIDHHKVGDVVYSMLNPTQFAQVHGSGWVLMDGRNIQQETDLRRMFSITNVPDARGIFIRGMNSGRDKGTGDPESDNSNQSILGRYQGDAMASHFHHLTNLETANTSPLPTNYLAAAAGLCCSQIPAASFEYALRASNTPPAYLRSSSVGGTDTRPRNISLYTYIKINEQ